MRCFVAGGAGFIGSNLVSSLLKNKCQVTVFDNLSGGNLDFLKEYYSNSGFSFIEGNLLDTDLLNSSIKGHDVVFHLAASSDISLGNKKTDLDMKNGFLTTFNILEGMRLNGIKKIIFTSSSSIYGKSESKPFCEISGGSVAPLSLYAASKVCSEAYLCAYSNLYGIRAWIFRLANIVGPNATHGVIFDFIRKLRSDPGELFILGDGTQVKPYLHVKECVDGMLFAFKLAKGGVNVFNLSCPGALNVKGIAAIVIGEMGLKNVRLKFSGGKIGWPGDQNRLYLDPKKINMLGWKAKMNSQQAVRLAVIDILRQGLI